MTASDRDPKQVLALLAEQKLSLELSTLDLCFITLLALKSEQLNLSAFGEEQLGDAFEQVCLALEPSTENVKARATHALRRLREQRLLARVDGAGVRRAGEYALTRLATGIVDFYVHSEPLTRESLTLLSRTLMLSLTEVLAAAREARDPEAWQARVIAPLRITVSDLVRGIEARQRGLDLEQEDFQRRISQLLSADWFGSLEQCQALLESTASTLRELNEVLLRGSHELQALLQDLLGVVTADDTDADDDERERAVMHVIEQVDRIGAWGQSRQQAWTEYYEYVHRYLQDVVRFDPARALTERLKKLLLAPEGRAYSLTLAHAPALGVLREVKPPENPPPVRRPKREPDAEPEARAAAPDPDQLMMERIEAFLAAGVTELSELTQRMTEGLPDAERFVAAGRIAKLLARITRPLARGERPWVVVDQNLAIEQWQVPEKRSV
ncbi:MAG TPA: condensin subunit MukF [Polyangiaceae bacterium]